MKFKIMLAMLVAAVAFIGLNSLTSAQDAATKDGKTIFTDAKCNMCHAVASAGIEVKNKNSKAPDLSNVGSTLKADFLAKYLKKDETIDNKKHAIAFKGSDDDLKTLTTWLESLKQTENK